MQIFKSQKALSNIKCNREINEKLNFPLELILKSNVFIVHYAGADLP